MCKSRVWLFLVVVLSCLPAGALAEKTKSGEKAAKAEKRPAEPPKPAPADQAKPGKPEAAAPETAAGDKAEPGGAEKKAAPEEGSAEAKPEMSKDIYSVRLRDLEDRVNRLKEQVFRSKARLSLLAETVLDRKIAGAKATIVFTNKMGGAFSLVKAVFLLDGAAIFNKSDEGGSLADRESVNLFEGPVMPGDHTLSAVLSYRGNGYGIFSYLKGYSFKTRSSRTFTISEGKALRLEVVGYEKGGVTTPLEERPDIRYVMNVSDYEDAEEKEAGKTEEPQGDAE